MKKIYICSEEQHNKFWSYEKNGNSVHVEWGRVGETGQNQDKHFGSSYEVDKFINKKVSEKEAKGYQEVDDNKLKHETETSQALGTRNKIKKMLWVSKKGDKLSQLFNYDPKQFIYVEILNSWTKDMTRLLLAKSESWEINGGISEEGRNIYINGLDKVNGNHQFVEAVRNSLKKMAQVIAVAIKSVQFGAIGVRKLFEDDDNEVPTTTLEMALDTVDSSGYDRGVVMKFASMGVRSLEL